MQSWTNQFGIIFNSSISNKRVLSINPWFLSTKSKARWPCKTYLHCIFLIIHSDHCWTMRLNSYRECCWSWATLIVIILRISKFWGHNYPASLINIVKFAFLSPPISFYSVWTQKNIFISFQPYSTFFWRTKRFKQKILNQI